MDGKIETNGAGSITGANTGAGNSIANPDLKKLERMVWIRCYEDGLMDVFLVGVLFALPLPLAIGFKELAGIRIGYTSFAVPGALIILMGFIVLSRFLRKYPPLREEY